MKKIIILTLVLVIRLTTYSQTTAGSRMLVYSETERAIVFGDSLNTKQTNLIIQSLPSLDEDSIPVRITLTRGKYTISKNPDLQIPFDYRVYIEDMWNERNYNLNSSEIYSFKVGSTEDERFILHIERSAGRASISMR